MSDKRAFEALLDDLLGASFDQDWPAEKQARAAVLQAFDEAQADSKAGWDAFAKMRKQVATEKWPDLTGTVYANTHPAPKPDAAAVPLAPTPEMIEAGAQRLVSWEDGCVWPDSWDALQVAAARNEAERVWRSMWLAASPARGGEEG